MGRFEEYIQTPVEFEKEILTYFGRSDQLVIFDIGSCEGEDSIRYARLFPNATIYAFEPLPENYRCIVENLSAYRAANVFAFQEAMSNAIGVAAFHVSSGHPDGVAKADDWDYGNKSSSLLAPDKVKENYAWLKFEQAIEVPTNTIENFCRHQGIRRVDFIHLDVQGSELMVLEGAGPLLANIRMIWMEVESVSLYRNQPLKGDVERFMRDHQFVNILDKVASVSGDQLYVNKRYFPEARPVPVPSVQPPAPSVVNRIKKAVKQRLIKRLLGPDFLPAANQVALKFRKGSYAQCGEDLIVRHIFEQWRMSTFRYLDIGAHHPFYLSNTALFYELGCRGVNVEPDTDLIGKFRKHRPEDVNLNVGIAQEAGELDFYVISTPTLNTFSREEVENYKKEGDHRVVRVDKVKVLPVRDIIGQHCGGVFPEFLTVDAEGIDELVMQSIDFENNYPLVICVETVSYSNSGKGEKKTGLIEFIAGKGYIVFADTNVNTIFVRSDKWVR